MKLKHVGICVGLLTAVGLSSCNDLKKNDVVKRLLSAINHSDEDSGEECVATMYEDWEFFDEGDAPSEQELPMGGSIEQFEWLATYRLQPSDLEYYSREELRILRNAIYAMHGYAFHSKDLQQYFAQFYDYRGVTRQAPAFNAVEKANIAMIQAYE